MTATEIAAAYDKLSDRDALRLLAKMADRFSGCGYAYDKLEAGIEDCAAALAEDEGYRPDRFSVNHRAELADRYLSDPVAFGRAA